MIEKIKNTISKFNLLSAGERVIVGFSGGIDSLTLLHILCGLTEYKLDIWALYINHSLRPMENIKEEELLAELGQKWGIHTHKVTIDIPGRLKEKPQSLQLLAREERYRVFRSFKEQIKADKVALAHHLDDQVETVLYRIIRGTGLDGLAGMPAIRDGFFIRPLLEVSRAEIREYVATHNLSWLEDSSNHKLIYQRNKIRLQLLPLLEETYNPRIKESILRLAKLAKEQHDFMAKLVAERLPDLQIKEEGRIGLKLGGFLQQPFYLQYCILRQLLLQVKPNYHLENMALDRLLDKINRENYQFKAMHIFKGISVYREGELIFLGLPQPNGCFREKMRYNLVAPGENVIAAINLRVDLKPALPPVEWSSVGDDEVYIGPSKLRLPLQIRFWQPGDFFRPLGGPGLQKLHDFFINKKLPRSIRARIPLLVTADDRIVWVVGYRLSDEFKVDPGDTVVWRITVAVSSKEV
jgi:tRNA(Ile)-lysidine synthase